MKIETINYINGNRVKLIAEFIPTKIYQDCVNINLFYIVSYDEVIAIFNIGDGVKVDIDEKYKKLELL